MGPCLRANGPHRAPPHNKVANIQSTQAALLARIRCARPRHTDYPARESEQQPKAPCFCAMSTNAAREMMHHMRDLARIRCGQSLVPRPFTLGSQ